MEAGLPRCLLTWPIFLERRWSVPFTAVYSPPGPQQAFLGPVVVNYMREYQLGLGIPREQVYNQTMYILVGMLVVGLICNLLVRPLDDKWFMSDEELAEERRLAHEKAAVAELVRGEESGSDDVVGPMVVVFAWAAVGIPLAWGVYRTLQSVAKFFA